MGKFTGATTVANSQIQDNGTSLSIGATTPSTQYLVSLYRSQLTATGDGQHTVYGYRTRDTQNDGTTYGVGASNSATAGYNFWGDLYTFGVAGYSYNDYTRTGGVLGAEQSGTYWGSLGYKNSASVSYGVYGSAAYASGAGLVAGSDKQGIGGGFYGGMIGSWSHGEVMGQVSSGEMFASYNMGNVYNSGFTADMVPKTDSLDAERVPAYAVTSPELKVYDNGSAQFRGSSVYVPFSSAYADMLGTAPDVTVSAVGSPAQLYIASVDKLGFTVAVASGEGSVRFSWIAVGSRKDASRAASMPSQLTSGSFDAQLKAAMTNENDPAATAQQVWWDGERVRFDRAPEQARPVKPEG